MSDSKSSYGDPVEEPRPVDDVVGSAHEGIADAEAALAPNGRLLMRESGTEPVVRVMAEGEDEAMVQRIVAGLCDRIKAVAAVQAA